MIKYNYALRKWEIEKDGQFFQGREGGGVVVCKIHLPLKTNDMLSHCVKMLQSR